jgi:hypothetical protein
VGGTHVVGAAFFCHPEAKPKKQLALLPRSDLTVLAIP